MQYHHTSGVPASHIIATITQCLLLACAALFGSLFAFNILYPVSVVLALIVAVAVLGLNFAEGYLVRFAVAGWRFGFTKLALLAALGALAISAYSLLAGYHVVESYLTKNQHSALATDYDIKAAEQRIQAAKSQALNAFNFGAAQADYMTLAAEENARIAALLRNKPAINSSVSPSTAAMFVALAVEAGIIFLTAFIELFLRPTPLPALVKFNDKLVEWGLDDSQLQNLEISASPSAGTVSLPHHDKTALPRVRTRRGGNSDAVPDVFEDWIQVVMSERIKPTVKDGKIYLRKHHNFKMEDAQHSVNDYLDRGYNLGYLDINEKSDAFSSQYVLANQKLLGQG